MKILMVCLGNICRSPLAQGIMQQQVTAKDLDWEVDSAGTAGYHIGKSPDHRSIAVAKKHGIDISSQRARQFKIADFESFDHIYVMDEQNYEDVMMMASTDQEKAKVRLFIPERNVIDPYYDNSLFEPVFQTITTQCAKLLTDLKNENR
ncbi:MAG: low molecular weight protein-tyrosine-phosphatase [Pelobium sp.]